ncbi:hypothetical protein NP493_112g04000 [Ridgeia piscesae]|uniref:Uncharacterized protein n=1 Tax=Ridgeia piscesae TaxID=27915 RepID=A0AAD9P6V6_RIDPI|nr:hypothetical protein NP493_112g04000 [Ridgeia piscesae]
MGGDVWRLLQHVRFPFCSRGFFADVVEPDVLMTGPECAGYVAECRKYHATAAEERRPEVGADDNKRLVPRDGMKVILVTGGFSNEGEVYGVWRYRHGLNACEPITTLPLRCAFISACAFATRLFVTGGQASSGQIVADTWSFCVRTQSWQRHARMCHARMLHSTAVVGGRLYAVGGQGNGSDVTQPADTRDNEVIPDDVELVSAEEYDADADEWRPLPDMLKAVKRPAVASFSGCMWVIGGSVDSMGVRSTDVVQVYDPTSGQWSYGTPLPEPLFCPGAVVVTDNRLYVYGGQRHTVYRYEPRQQLWRALAVASQGHMEGGCVYWQGKLLLLGGKSDAGRTDIVEAYDVHNDSWSRCECPLPKSLSSHTVALVKSC